jgi:hypothetical protein
MTSHKRKNESELGGPRQKSNSPSQGKFRRSGKWSDEEEALALQLIIEFENGTFNSKECPTGCTLRSFLSRRLSCAPMRISKKFAKKQIGKLIYAPKLDAGVQFEHSVLKRLEMTYLASNPFDRSNESEPCDRAEESDDSTGQFPANDGECGTDGSVASDSDDTASNGFCHDDLGRHLCNDIAFFENEAEEWKDVLTYYFTHNEEFCTQLQ